MPVTLITGSNSGIGLATALHLAGRGHKVYASMRDLNRGQELRETATHKQLPIELIELDVDHESSVNEAVGEVLEREGHIDVLVNNAGVGLFGTIETTSEAAAKSVFETNFFGALRTIRAVLPSMRERRSGTIVNISSVAGRVALACTGIYASSKFALEGASEALAQEVYPFGIRVVIVQPSIIVTPILEKSLSSVPLDPNSPYANAERRVHLIFSQGQQTGGDPRLVAEAIESAVTANEPRMRYVAGLDADAIVAGRARMGDEAWAAMGRHVSDEEYFQEFSARFPTPP